jgi:hypothetical protein
MTSCDFGIGPNFIGGHAGRADQRGIDRPLPEQLPPPAERMPGHQSWRLWDQQVAVERIAADAH